MTSCEPVITDIRIVGPTLQIQVDGQWQDVGSTSETTFPDADLSSYTDKRCVMSTWVRNETEELVDNFLNIVEAGTDVAGILPSLIGPLSVFGIALDLLAGAIIDTLDLGVIVIRTYLTAQKWDDIQCSLHCFLDETNPVFTTTVFSDWLNDLRSWDLTAGLVAEIIEAHGYQNLKYIAWRSQFTTGSEPSCAFCDCEIQTFNRDFLNGDGWDNDWIIGQHPLQADDRANATYQSGPDWVAGGCFVTGSGRFLRFDGPVANYTSLAITFSVNKTRSGTDQIAEVWIGATKLVTVNKTTLGTQVYNFSWTGDLSGVLRIQSFVRNNTCGDAAYARVTDINVQGVGTDPFA